MSGTPLSVRLNQMVGALPGGNFDAKLESLHDFIREQGVRGVHSTRYTLRRWFRGEGTPPDYWMELAAKFCGVSFRWAKFGDGLKSKVEKTPPERRTPPETAPPEEEIEEIDPKELEEPEKVETVVPAPPPLPREEEEVLIPLMEEVHSSNSPTIRNFLARTQSIPTVEAILEHEPKNPNYKGGRVTVLREAKARLAILQGE